MKFIEIFKVIVQALPVVGEFIISIRKKRRDKKRTQQQPQGTEEIL